MLDGRKKLNELKQEIRSKVLVTSQTHRIISIDEISRAPWLFDFRALLLQPKWLKLYAQLFWDTFEDEYPFQVCGMESAAISLVAAIVVESESRGKPANGLFIRKSRKRTGLLKQLEGTANEHPVILVDDLLNSGSTFEKQIQVLERENLHVSALFSLLAFRQPDYYAQKFKDRTIRSFFSLDDFAVTIEAHPQTAPALHTVWHFAAPNPAYNHVVQKSAPVIDEERIYFGSDSGTFYALNQEDGTIAWTFETGRHPDGKGIFSTPALHNDIVYFGAYDGNVYALDAKTGAKQWEYSDADWVGSSPALAPDKDLLFIGLEFGLWRKRGGMVALNMRTGERVWQDRTPEFTHGSPLYIKEKNMVVTGSNDAVIYAYEADSGKTLWRYRAPGSVKSSFTYDKKNDLIYFGTLGGAFCALSSDGVPVFAKDLHGGMYSTPLFYHDTVYAASLDKLVHAYDKAGAEKWMFETYGRIFASPVLAAGKLYIGSNDGRLYEIDPETGRGNSVFQATERVVNAIAYNKKSARFFVPTHANEMYCLEKK